MKSLINIVLCLVICLSCAEKHNNKENLNDYVTFDSVTVHEKIILLPEMGDESPFKTIDINFVYPVSMNDQNLLHQLQHFFMDEPAEKVVDAMVTENIDDYTSFTREVFLELKESLDDFEKFMHKYHFQSKIEFVNKNLLSYSVDEFLYNGLNQGSHELYYKVIDLNKMKLLNESDIFVSGYKYVLRSILTDKIFTAFTNKTGIEEDDIEWEFRQLLFKTEPNNIFYLTDKGLFYLFNEHELPYQFEQKLTIFIEYAEVYNILNPDFLKMIE